MKDPAYAIQVAFFAALTDPPIVIDGETVPVFTDVPAGAGPLYIAFGADQTLDDRADCIKGSETFAILDTWDRQGERWANSRLKRLTDAIRDRLDEAPLTLDGHRLIGVWFQEARYLADPDGKSRHGVLTFRLLTEPSGE